MILDKDDRVFHGLVVVFTTNQFDVDVVPYVYSYKL